MAMKDDVGLIHFVGIGGIGMSAIAEVLHNRGFRVQGSDMNDGANVKRLRDKGIEVFVPHGDVHVDGAEVVVLSTAIRPDNVEVIAAREKNIPVCRRAEMLAEVMRFSKGIAVGGTHGKTTTTSMVGTLLEAAGQDPTIINGGIINHLGTNVRMGDGDWTVVEADESDGSFLKLPAEVAVVTNIDPEHLDHYGTFDAAKAAFRQFIENVPFYGFAALCLDHPEVQRLVGQIEDRRVVTYGESPQSEVQFANVRPQGAASVFDVTIRPRPGARSGEVVTLTGLRLPMPGRHNVSNATGAIAVAHNLGIGPDAIREGLASFRGVKRRFTHAGSWNGIEIYDDYAHHPVELRATLSAARGSTKGNVVAIVQPHRYTRLRDLYEDFAACFNDADKVVVAPVYEAGEQPIAGVDADGLVSRIRAAGHRDARAITGPTDIAPLVADIARPGDVVVLCGAGNISTWAHALARELEALGEGKTE